jgi:hypothetical protein
MTSGVFGAQFEAGPKILSLARSLLSLNDVAE